MTKARAETSAMAVGVAKACLRWTIGMTWSRECHMPGKQTLGVSEWTLSKQSDFRSIIRMHLMISDAVLANNPYFSQIYQYVDATAGPGRYWHRNMELVGSPVVFLEEAAAVGITYEAHFFESDPSSYEQLEQNIAGFDNEATYVHPEDSTIAVGNALGEVDSKQLGLFYVDPENGIPDMELVAEVAAKRPKMEILMYLSATNLKRKYEITGNTLTDYIEIVNRLNWLVRMPLKGDPHQWTFVLASNADIFSDYKKIRLYSLDSDEARNFFPRLDLTGRAYRELNQLKLFDFEEESTVGE